MNVNSMLPGPEIEMKINDVRTSIIIRDGSLLEDIPTKQILSLKNEETLMSKLLTKTIKGEISVSANYHVYNDTIYDMAFEFGPFGVYRINAGKIALISSKMKSEQMNEMKLEIDGNPSVSFAINISENKVVSFGENNIKLHISCKKVEFTTLVRIQSNLVILNKTECELLLKDVTSKGYEHLNGIFSLKFYFLN